MPSFSRLNTLDDQIDGLGDQAVQMENYAIRLEDRLGAREEDYGINRRDFNHRLDTLSNEMSMAGVPTLWLSGERWSSTPQSGGQQHEGIDTIECAATTRGSGQTTPSPWMSRCLKQRAAWVLDMKKEKRNPSIWKPSPGHIEVEPEEWKSVEVDEADGHTAEDVPMEPHDLSGCSQRAVEDLQKELNAALNREDHEDAARVQTTILELLDRAAAASTGRAGGAAGPSSSTG